MWNLLKRNRVSCSTVRDAIEDGSALAPELREHLTDCNDCQGATVELETSRALLRTVPVPHHEPSPWFAARVMSAIAAREAELRRSLETWNVLPRLAAKLTLVSALALLLAGTWLYERPQATTPGANGTESLFENAPSAPPQDDVLISALERMQ